VMLQLAFVGTGLGNKAAMTLRTAVRLSDKAVLEYLRARQMVLAQINESNRPPEEMAKTGRIIYMFAFVDHMENCINACRRLLALLDRVKSDTSIPDNAPVKIAVEHALSKDVFDFRNTIEHMEERIESGQIRDGEPVVLMLSADSKAIEVGRHRMSLESLASLLVALHGAVESLTNVSPERAAI